MQSCCLSRRRRRYELRSTVLAWQCGPCSISFAWGSQTYSKRTNRAGGLCQCELFDIVLLWREHLLMRTKWKLTFHCCVLSYYSGGFFHTPFLDTKVSNIFQDKNKTQVLFLSCGILGQHEIAWCTIQMIRYTVFLGLMSRIKNIVNRLIM